MDTSVVINGSCLEDLKATLWKPFVLVQRLSHSTVNQIDCHLDKIPAEDLEMYTRVCSLSSLSQTPPKPQRPNDTMAKTSNACQ